MNYKSNLVVVLAASVLLAAQTAAAAPTIFGAAHAERRGPSQFYSIDPVTGAATAIGTGIGFNRVSGMDFHPVTGMLYATGEKNDGTAVLITIDPATGVGSIVAPLNDGVGHTYGSAYADLSFRNGDNVLYAYLDKHDGLGTIDLITGALVEKGATKPDPNIIGNGNGTAFSSADVLYNADQNSLHILDQDNGFANPIGPMLYSPPADNVPRINAMDFDPGTGILYGSLQDGSLVVTPENYIVTIDINSGAATILGPTALGMDALAVQSPPIINQPPDCSGAVPSIDQIWPPNHMMVDIEILGITDPDGDPVSIIITGITQDEPVNGVGDGNTAPDGTGVGTSSAQVRAERSGVPGNGRVYAISFEAADDQGETCSGVVTICVPHSENDVCVDDGQTFDATAGAAKPAIPDPQPATWGEIKQRVE